MQEPAVLTSASSRPLVSLAILAYQQESLVADAIQGAFAQTYQPLEIILSDDHSPDRTADVMRDAAAAYAGPHEVRVLTADANHGFIAHLNRVLAAARGEWIVLCAGDDRSLPERCERLIAFSQQVGGLRGIFSGFIECRENLEPHRDVTPIWPQQIGAWKVCRNGGYVFPGASFALHRSCVEFFGDLPPNLRAEDWALPLRAALLGRVGFCRDHLLLKRELASSLTRINKAEDAERLGKSLRPVEFATNLQSLRVARQHGRIGMIRAIFLGWTLRAYRAVFAMQVAGLNASVLTLGKALIASLFLGRKRDAWTAFRSILMGPRRGTART